jgi:hypothetical protein
LDYAEHSIDIFPVIEDIFNNQRPSNYEGIGHPKSMEETSPQVEANANAAPPHPHRVSVTLSFELRAGQRTQVTLDTHPGAELIMVEGQPQQVGRAIELPAESVLVSEAQDTAVVSASAPDIPVENIPEGEMPSEMMPAEAQADDVDGIKSELKEGRTLVTARVNFDSPAFVAIFTGLTLIVASIPSVLVLQDRWLRSPVLTSFFQPL